MRHGRIVAAAALALAAVVAASAQAMTPTEPRRPAITFDGDVPWDVRALATDTWRGFTDAFSSRWSCIPDVALDVAWTMPDRATYDPSRNEIVVRVPWTSANLEVAMLHEFAHHVEFTCIEHLVLRPRFLGSTGLDLDTPWRGGDDWATIPSERAAEATVAFVLGGPPPHVVVPLDDAEIAAIAEWAEGG